MSEKISANRAGLIFGAIFAASHVAWIGFVVSGVSETAVATVARTNFVEYEDTVDFDLSLSDWCRPHDRVRCRISHGRVVRPALESARAP